MEMLHDDHISQRLVGRCKALSSIVRYSMVEVVAGLFPNIRAKRSRKSTKVCSAASKPARGWSGDRRHSSEYQGCNWPTRAGVCMSPEKLMLTFWEQTKKQDCLLIELVCHSSTYVPKNIFPSLRPNVHLLAFLRTKLYVWSVLPLWKWIAGLRHPTLRQVRLNFSGSLRLPFRIYKRNVRPRKPPISACSSGVSKLFSNAFMTWSSSVLIWRRGSVN